MHIGMRVAAAALVAAVAVAPALGFEDPATGFKFEPPAPYTTASMSGPSTQLSLAIPPVPDGPRPVMGMPQLCAIAFETEPSGPKLATQAEIDAAIAGPTYLRDVGVNESLWSETTQASFMTASGASGIEVMGPMAGDPAITFYFAIARTPAGQATLTCVYESAVTDTALPLFRQFRDAMALPN